MPNGNWHSYHEQSSITSQPKPSISAIFMGFQLKGNAFELGVLRWVSRQDDPLSKPKTKNQIITKKRLFQNHASIWSNKRQLGSTRVLSSRATRALISLSLPFLTSTDLPIHLSVVTMRRAVPRARIALVWQ